MRNPGIDLQTEYFRLLNGAITGVAVYDAVPNNPVYPYIEIGNYTNNSLSDKSNFGNAVIQSVSVVDRQDAVSGGSRKRLYEVVDAMMQIICARPTPFTTTGWNFYVAVLDNELYREELTTTHRYRISEIRIRHQIQDTTTP
jgi:hypothetical protein